MRTLAVFAVLIAAARAAGPPVAPERVAVFDLTRVLRKAKQFAVFEAELKAEVVKYQATDDDLRQRAEAIGESLRKPGLSPERKMALQSEIEKLFKQSEDNKSDGSKALAAKQEEQLVVLFRSVEAAARKIGRARGFAAVLHYNGNRDTFYQRADIEPEPEYADNRSIRRGPFSTGALCPACVVRSSDITDDIIKEMNAAFRAKR